ncbi:protein MTSS 1-like [Corticium candelabrum]|uniref:protein MTSS 1-like n=1 Tax=Corticium candelabrum TaxID=121492 RepID=UPI002E265683|nr:protein MTSS 1-like [Corticium candelabrum]
MDEAMSLSSVGSLFQALFSDLRGSKLLFEDIVAKAERLSRSIESAAVASHVFLDSFQKVADAAISAKGATRELGTALTKMCMRHRALEVKAADISRMLNSALAQPLTTLIREWDRTTRTLEADHERESRKAVKSAKRAAQDTIKRVKETDKLERKGKGSVEMQGKMEESMKAASESYQHVEEVERFWMRKLLIEQRSRYCKFVQCFKPVAESEVALLEEATHVNTILSDTLQLVVNPHVLPGSSEELIADLKVADPVNLSGSPAPSRRSRAATDGNNSDSGRRPSSVSSGLSDLSNYTNGSLVTPTSPTSIPPDEYPPPPLPPSVPHYSGNIEQTQTLPPPPPPQQNNPPPLPPPNVPKSVEPHRAASPQRLSSPQRLPSPRLPSQSSVPSHQYERQPSPLVPKREQPDAVQTDRTDSDDDEGGESSFLAALKKAKLKKAATSDRSGPNV